MSSDRRSASMETHNEPALDRFSLIETCKTAPVFSEIPTIDLSEPNAKTRLVNACEEFGFFKVINHGVQLELMTTLQAEALKFFNLPQSEKDNARPPSPLGYGSMTIGPLGDMGWVEYLLLKTDIISQDTLSISQEYPAIFRSAVNDYIQAVKNVAYEVLELIGDGLNIQPKTVLSEHLKDEKSDSILRINHYPPCPAVLEGLGEHLTGFGEHTDPQIISILRSNNVSGLEICLRNETWVSVPADHNSFFISVGDCLQVMTNGRFRSVRHRVLVDGLKSRVSFIYFGGPSLSEKIAPLPSLMQGEESLYNEFTWGEYKSAAYKSRLGDNRLALFGKNASQ